MIDLPGCACYNLNVLNPARPGLRAQPGHTPCVWVLEELLGSVSWELLDKKEWRKKNHFELFETI